MSNPLSIVVRPDQDIEISLVEVSVKRHRDGSTEDLPWRKSVESDGTVRYEVRGSLSVEAGDIISWYWEEA